MESGLAKWQTPDYLGASWTKCRNMIASASISHVTLEMSPLELPCPLSLIIYEEYDHSAQTAVT